MKQPINVRRVDKNNRKERRRVVRIFIEGYYEELSIITKDYKLLEETFLHAINPNVFYVAEIEGEVVGIMACVDRHSRAMVIKKQALIGYLGQVKGRLAYRLLYSYFNLPVDLAENTAYIDAVATQKESQGKGVATALFKLVQAEGEFKHFMLDVTDTNKSAYRLYEKLGFKEIKRKPVKFKKIRGFNERIYMKF